MFDCMSNCIHLKACRRIQAIGRSHRLLVPRYCSEKCSAYVDGQEHFYVTPDDAISYARSNYDGYHDPYDVYCSSDFGIRGQSLLDIVNDLQSGEEGEG